MLKHCIELFKVVENYIIKEKGYLYTKVAKISKETKDISTDFDIEAENRIIEYCKTNRLPVIINSEESGMVPISRNPEYVLLIDPVDGSTNLKKRIEGSAVCITGLTYRGDNKLNASDVQFSLIGSLLTHSVVTGTKGQGVKYNGIFSGYRDISVSGSQNTYLSKACLEIDMDYGLDEVGDTDLEEAKKFERILPLFYPRRQFKHLRRNGSAALGMMGVLMGHLDNRYSGLDAYLDARDLLTPENWLGALMLTIEAGGKFTDLDNNTITDIPDTLTPYSFLATGNPILHDKIIEAIKRQL
jgi:myo-inositol-1(or 4)-monophosphatase